MISGINTSMRESENQAVKKNDQIIDKRTFLFFKTIFPNFLYCNSPHLLIASILLKYIDIRKRIIHRYKAISIL